MHLKQLKLAGFKSFVEPTVIPFSSPLMGVVGPNGCGKSNIIDAVRWVMGESSAKHLRGESMADVIFNGSTHRSALGQASVELLFDNRLGRLAGQYSTYQEIAVKRVVTKDGDSFYYLNGTRCRRRDITDIFLGTGAGARSYSIIGQDTISRLVEARPEDLRAYLEEAAGVSKYKERRRESIQRIGLARENLARVSDIREELSKQLQRLERQAQTANRYKTLKQEERLCTAEIHVLKWQKLTSEKEHIHQAYQELSVSHEGQRRKIVGLIEGNARIQALLHQTQEDVERLQQTFYQLNLEMARLEDSIEQHRRESERLGAERQLMDTDLQRLVARIKFDSDALQNCEQEIVALEQTIPRLQKEAAAYQTQFDENEQKKLDWERRWQDMQSALHQCQREAQVEEARLQQMDQRHQQMQLRDEKIQNERRQMDLQALTSELAAIQREHAILSIQLQSDKEKHQRVVSDGTQLRHQLTESEKKCHQIQDTLRVLTTEEAALTAAQNAMLRSRNKGSPTLSKWNNSPRLAEMLLVPEEWMRACEMVLGAELEAIVLDSLDEVWPLLNQLKGAPVHFFQSIHSYDSKASYPRLADKIEGRQLGLPPVFDHVFAAKDLNEALMWLPTLSRDQSIVTPDGYWLGPGWIKVDGVSSEDESSVLLRQHAIIRLQERLMVEQSKCLALQEERDQSHAKVIENVKEQAHYLDQLTKSQEAFRQCEARLASKQHALQHATTRLDVLSEEEADLQTELQDLAIQRMHSEHRLQSATQAMLQYQQQDRCLQDEKSEWEVALVSSRQLAAKAREAMHQIELKHGKETLKYQQLRDSINRDEREKETLQTRKETLDRRTHELLMPDKALQDRLGEKVIEHHKIEDELARLRHASDALQKEWVEGERLVKLEEHQANEMQEMLQQKQLQEQALAVRAEGALEALGQLNVKMESILSMMPLDVSLDDHQKKLEWLGEKINRLGAINLVAIEEYQTELERKKHLDDQYDDLMTALDTLESAISKMDRETQFRLKETFDQVNTSFQILFPRLFGGGRACLELTCDNLLEAGVLVMAQPPGKRNSTIHILSGGEKAMTAVALVFAIFQLNPSPFCMLDEVDAPLDDLNIKRFCDLVKEMSDVVQFLFITHNKVTMELADHLIGVTMREPGVSRVVAVDVEKALAMAK